MNLRNELIFLLKTCSVAGILGFSINRYKVTGTIGPIKTKRYYAIQNRLNVTVENKKDHN